MGLSTEEQTKLAKSAKEQLLEAVRLKNQFLAGEGINTLATMAGIVAQSILQGGKLLLCGNGGSAADAQHLAAELLVRLRPHQNRAAIPALSLALDSSSLTACANDYGFEKLYERMLEGLGKPEDVILGLSTSGRSENVIKALQLARKMGLPTLGFLGNEGGPMKEHCDHTIIIPSKDPNRIQEVHIAAGHILMDLIETLLVAREFVSLI